LVYVSSIKVNGEETIGGQRYSEVSASFPTDPYGLSKWEAEQALQRVAAETGLELVVIRPPLVYGMGVKGNFAQMLSAVSRRFPLPFAAVINQRSLIYVGNLVDVLIVCATHPAASGNVYLVSDGDDVSTPELLRRLGDAMGRPARIFPIPKCLLSMMGKIAGLREQLPRLTGSLQIDCHKICSELNWKPPYSLHQGLQKTAEWYRDTHR
jgi:nucleoside-diphosphate-sugar epimerase